MSIKLKFAFFFAIWSLAFNALAQVETDLRLDWVHSFESYVGYQEPFYTEQIEVDIAGNSVVAGYILDTPVDMMPGPGVAIVNPQNNYRTWFIAKYSLAGQLLWVYTFEYTYENLTIAVWGEEVYYAGHDLMVSVPPVLRNNIQMGCINNIGGQLWEKTLIGNPDGGSDITLDLEARNNLLYLCGTYTGYIHPNPGNPSIRLTADGDPGKIFFARYDMQGNYHFAKDFGQSESSWAITPNMAITPLNEIILSGELKTRIDFQTNPGQAPIVYNYVPPTFADLYLVKYSDAGDFVWAGILGEDNYSNEDVAVPGVEVDRSGNIYWGGRYHDNAVFEFGGTIMPMMPTLGKSDGFLAKISPTGNLLNVTSLKSPGLDCVQNVSIDEDGNPVVAGYVTGACEFDTYSSNSRILGSPNIQTTFVAKYNPTQGLIYAETLNASPIGESRCYDFKVTPTNSLFLWGEFDGTIDFGIGMHDVLRSSRATERDCYLAKYSELNCKDTITLVEHHCDSVIFNGVTYFADFDFTDGPHLNAQNCDSLTITKFNIHNQFVFPLRTDTACEEYFWRGKQLFASGNYSDTVPGNYGCGDVYLLKLKIEEKLVDTTVVKICSGDNYLWAKSGLSYSAAGFYDFNVDHGQACDSVYTLHVKLGDDSEETRKQQACNSYFWSETNQNYTSSGTYTKTYVSEYGCDSVLKLELDILPGYFNLETVEVCDSYYWSVNNRTYTSSVTVEEMFIGQNGCDSTEALMLTIKKSSPDSRFLVEQCEGTTYTWPETGQTYNSAGEYSVTFQNKAGCDSLVILDFQLIAPQRTEIEVSDCEPYFWPLSNKVYNASKLDSALILSSKGCDSLVVLQFNLLESNNETKSVATCDNPYLWTENGQNYSSSGVYSVTYKNRFGCDSVINLDLTINPSQKAEFTEGHCYEYTWPETGVKYTTSGDYNVVYQNQYGCDSTLVLHLSIYQDNAGSEDIVACESYFWTATGINYTSSGTYNATLQNQYGCDSLATLNLEINYNQSTTIVHAACGSYLWPDMGQTLVNSGTYNALLVSSNGCDSLVTLNLTIHPEFSETQSVGMCEGPYTWSETGISYTTSGQYSKTYLDRYGCDSTYVLDLSIWSTETTNVEIHACIEYLWDANGTTYTNSGQYSELLSSQYGCDSLVVLDLYIHQPNSGSESIVACDSYTWSATGQTYTSDGTYNASLKNQWGCDSTATMYLTLNASDFSSVDVEACEEFFWDETGETYKFTSTYSKTYTNALGCDSVLSLNLIIHPASLSQKEVVLCDESSYSWTFNNQTYSSSGVYRDTLTSVYGCDSIAEIDLQFYSSSRAVQTVSACNEYTWLENGLSYNQTTMDSVVYTGPNGCDSTLVLDLSIYYSDSTKLNIEACASFYWPITDSTYLASGQYFQTLNNEDGCDSVVNLDLTIWDLESDYDTINTCYDYFWTPLGQTLTESGDYSTVVSDSHGCDSSLYLNLKITKTSYDTLSGAACYSFLWDVNGTTYSESGLYTEKLSNSLGCDSIVSLDLTIFKASQDTLQTNACEQFTWAKTGATYTNSGWFTWDTVNTSGCDSTVFLNLNIFPHDTLIENTQECDSYFWLVSGETYTTSGVYEYSGTNPNGCSRTYYLNLSLNASPSSEMRREACNQFYWSAIDSTFYESTKYSANLGNDMGCDSVVNLDLQIWKDTTVVAETFACDSFYWPESDEWYYDDITTDVRRIGETGCDSILQLELELGRRSFGNSDVLYCDKSYYWEEAGISLDESGAYSYVFTNRGGCDSVHTIQLQLSDIDVDIEVVGSTIEVSSESGLDYTYAWEFCDKPDDCSPILSTDSIIEAEYNGDYFVVVNSDLCMDRFEIPYGNQDCFIPFYIPNTFSPNGDGKNDLFFVQEKYCPVFDFKLSLYNRWGMLIFQTDNINFVWDGKFRGNPVMEGTLSYVVNYKLREGISQDDQVITGQLTVLR